MHPENSEIITEPAAKQQVYLGYKFVLGGFYPDEEKGIARAAAQQRAAAGKKAVEDMFNRDVDSYATKNSDDSEQQFWLENSCFFQNCGGSLI